MKPLRTGCGLPSEMMSARPDAADKVPRVTMKSVIPPLATIVPLTRPTAEDATTPARIAHPIPAPEANTCPSTTAPNVMLDATDRSMPAVATTNVCPTARTTRIALACRMAWMLPLVRNVESSVPNTMTSRNKAAGAASSGQWGRCGPLAETWSFGDCDGARSGDAPFRGWGR